MGFPGLLGLVVLQILLEPQELRVLVVPVVHLGLQVVRGLQALQEVVELQALQDHLELQVVRELVENLFI